MIDSYRTPFVLKQNLFISKDGEFYNKIEFFCKKSKIGDKIEF